MSRAASFSYYQQYCKTMTNFINETQIRILCDQVAQLPDLQPILAHSQKKYHTNIHQETPTSILDLVRKVNDREGKKQTAERARGTHLQFWAFGERKIFCWVLVFYSHLNGVSIQSMTQRHLLALQAIFHQKSLEFLNYEVTSIVKGNTKTKEPWTEQEILFLTRIVERSKEKLDWRAISFMLFVEGKGATFKALQECREKWCNYLNPQLNKESWSLEEDYQLFELIEREGCRWALISRRLKLKRTEHMVKNRYNAYLRNWKNKRSNVKTKKGLTGRILAYLRARIHKKLKREEQQETERADSQLPTPEPEEHNEYSSNQMPSYEEDERMAKIEASSAREAYIVEKKEKNTADCDESLAPVSPQVVSSQEDGRSFSLQLMVNSFGGIQFTSGKEEMKLVEDDVVRALGCSHFQRALEPYQYDVFEDSDSLSWLI